MTESMLLLLMALARVVVGASVVWLLARMLKAFLWRLTRRTRTSADEVVADMVMETAPPLGYLAAVLWGWKHLLLSRDQLAIAPWADRLVEGLVHLVAIVLVVRLVNKVLLWFLERSLIKVGRESQVTTLQALNPMIRTLIWIIGALVFLQNQGVGLGAVYASLAGAGIGVGLALKGPISNFINYLTILFDQPFEIGQVIQFDDVVATVEQVGMRSSNLRSIDGELIVISNEELLNQTIRNYGDFPRRRLIQTIGVVYQTPTDKVAAIPATIEQLIREAQPAEFDRCHFIRFGDSCLEFEFAYYVPSGDLVEALNVRQQVNMSILRKFEQEGIEFAYPTQTLYLEKTT